MIRSRVRSENARNMASTGVFGGGVISIRVNEYMASRECEVKAGGRGGENALFFFLLPETRPQTASGAVISDFGRP